MLLIQAFTTTALLASLTLARVLPLPPPYKPTSTSTVPLPTATTVHRFPNGTWVENLAIRSNGGILVDFGTSPQVAYVDPAAPEGKEAPIIATFPAPATGALGIAELTPDVFYVATSAVGFAGPTPNGTGQIWEIDMRKYDKRQEAKVTLVANLTESVFLNGVAALGDMKTLLVADPEKGLIWNVNVQTGDVM